MVPLSPVLMGVWHTIKSMKPAFISKNPHFNFITLHYFWVIGWALVGSVCLFANGGIHYIDALFLGSGAATQSGLNTIDINLLTTWQQIVLFFVPIFTNPITINSLVVLFRLVLFEKRFKKIAADKKKNRRSLAKTFSHSKTSLDQNIDREEMGVRGRSIVVMHDTTVPNGMTTERSRAEEFAHHMEKINAIEEEPARSSNDSGRTERQPSDKASRSKSPGAADRPSAGIKFADQLKPGANGVVFGDLNSGDVEEEERRPSHRTPEEHIAILERQRKQDDGAVLRIPGPRDADAGVAPQAVEDSDVLSRTMSRRASTHQSGGADVDAGALNGDDHPTHDIEAAKRRNITITEPQKEPVGERATKDTASAKHSMGGLRFRKNRLSRHTTEKDDDGSMTEPVTRTGTLQRIRTALTTSKDEGAPYLSWEPTVGRNSLFFDLTEDQREELGGIEYRSLKSLAAILAVYFVGFSLVGLVSLLPWILKSPTYGSIVTNVGQGKAWWAIFTANSAFTDLGFTLTPDSMISFQTAVWPLLIMSFLIIIGNTGFPIMLRFMIWVLSKIVPEGSGIWEELKFLLDHPRRCFTLLFPSGATWILFLILCGLNGLDLLFFIILDFGNSVVTQLPVHIRVLDGWFQAASTRTAGFAVVNLALLHPAIQVSYLIMMYISVLPIAMSVRRTNVYEEDSLGVYGNVEEENSDQAEPSYIGAHLRRQLSFDLWYIFLGFFIITISEGSRLQSGDPGFTMFNVLFEIVSAYGTVGLSLGYTNINASFSAEFGVIAKLVIIAMQIRGRHRGLPYELDRAVMLNSELQAKREADLAAARPRRNSDLSRVNTMGTKIDRTASRATSSRGGSNIFTTLLHPGPTIPNSHPYRNANVVRTRPVRERRHSIAATPMRRGMSRSMSPTVTSIGARENTLMGTALGADGAETLGRIEGRRSFFKEGVNPAPPTNLQ